MANSLKIAPEGLSDAIKEIADIYSDEVKEKLLDAAKETAAEVKDEIDRNITFKGRRYRKAMAIKKNQKGTGYIWYVKKPYYRLTHLLEYGHMTRDGRTRTKAYPHIIYGQKLGERVFPEKVMQKLGEK